MARLMEKDAISFSVPFARSKALTSMHITCWNATTQSNKNRFFSPVTDIWLVKYGANRNLMCKKVGLHLFILFYSKLLNLILKLIQIIHSSLFEPIGYLGFRMFLALHEII